jgi:prevent-host-death family protein
MYAVDVATSVGVRELKNHLSRYLELVRGGEDVVVTDRGSPIARLSPIDTPTDRLADLIAAGLVTAPTARARTLPRRIKADGTVSDLVAAQRR